MSDFAENNSWLARRLETVLKSTLARAYETVRVQPEEYLMHLRMAHGVPAMSYDGMFSVPVSELTQLPSRPCAGP